MGLPAPAAPFGWKDILIRHGAPGSTAGPGPDEYLSDGEARGSFRGYLAWGAGRTQTLRAWHISRLVPGAPGPIDTTLTVGDGRALAQAEIRGWSSIMRAASPGRLAGFTFQGPAYIHRDVPMPHPKYQVFDASQAGPVGLATGLGGLSPSCLYARSVRFQPDGAATGLPDQLGLPFYDEAACDIGFWDPGYAVVTDNQMMDLQSGLAGLQGITYPREDLLIRYVRVWVEPRNRIQSLPAFRTLRWVPFVYPIGQQTNPAQLANPNAPGNVTVVGDGSTKPVANQDDVILPELYLNVEWVQIPVGAVDYTKMAGLVQTCNQQPLGSALSIFPWGGPWPAGVCIFLGGTTRRPYRMANNAWAVDIRYRWLVKPFGANWLFNWITGRYQPFSRDGATTVAYDSNSNAVVVRFPVADPNNPNGPLIPGGVGDPTQLIYPPADHRVLFQPT